MTGGRFGLSRFQTECTKGVTQKGIVLPLRQHLLQRLSVHFYTYKTRLSFCCASEGCRHRTTPPSVHFLGCKSYLGVIVILITALEHGLSLRRRQWLMDIWP